MTPTLIDGYLNFDSTESVDDYLKDNPTFWGVFSHRERNDLIVICIDGEEVICFTLQYIEKDKWGWFGDVLFRQVLKLVTDTRKESSRKIFKDIHRALGIEKYYK